MMKNFVRSKFFVPISTAASLVISLVAGILLGSQPETSGRVTGGYGSVDTDHVFQFRVALGYWLLGLLLTAVVCLLCVLVRAHFLQSAEKEEK